MKKELKTDKIDITITFQKRMNKILSSVHTKINLENIGIYDSPCLLLSNQQEDQYKKKIISEIKRKEESILVLVEYIRVTSHIIDFDRIRRIIREVI